MEHEVFTHLHMPRPRFLDIFRVCDHAQSRCGVRVGLALGKCCRVVCNHAHPPRAKLIKPYTHLQRCLPPSGKDDDDGKHAWCKYFKGDIALSDVSLDMVSRRVCQRQVGANRARLDMMTHGLVVHTSGELVKCHRCRPW